jgi:arylsulfatase A-like enzyme
MRNAWMLPVVLAACASSDPPAPPVPGPERPSIVLILADDLGYGDLGAYGQQKIATPRLDRMAAEGIRFTQFYAGSTVCAPSRSVLMTGQDMGHTFVRGNAGGRNMNAQTLRAEDVTVAERLREAGYATALIGKWGLGELGSSGHPLSQGFDHFFGYLNQVHAHNYYPEFLWRGTEQQKLRNEVVPVGEGYGAFRGGYATKRVDYSHDLLVAEARDFIRQQRERPFFLYLALTIPHANNEGARVTGNGQEVPDLGQYAGQPWSESDRGLAAMVTRMDGDVGRLLDQLRELGVDRRTLVLFSSDNGPHTEGGRDLELLDSNGPLRGTKRDLYEGGIRVPMVAWWPGTIAPGVSEHVSYLGDLMATACELAGVETPPDTQSLSFVPTLRGQPAQPRHPYLYWEFYEQGSKQAVRFGDWKAVRAPMRRGPVELYDLSRDLGEETDLAGQYPERVAEAIALMEAAHAPNPNWPIPAGE